MKKKQYLKKTYSGQYLDIFWHENNWNHVFDFP